MVVSGTQCTKGYSINPNFKQYSSNIANYYCKYLRLIWHRDWYLISTSDCNDNRTLSRIHELKPHTIQVTVAALTGQRVYKIVYSTLDAKCTVYLMIYTRQTSNIRRTLVGNIIIDHSDVVGAAPTGDAPTTSEWSTINPNFKQYSSNIANYHSNKYLRLIWHRDWYLISTSDFNDKSNYQMVHNVMYFKIIMLTFSP